MRVVKAAVSGLVGILAGVLIGFAVWAPQAGETENLSGELEQTKAWLLDEIRWCDERYEPVAASLTKTQAELTDARGELVRVRATLEQTRAALEQARANNKPTPTNDLKDAVRPTSAR
jgi:type II secretory pathway component PulM